MSKVKSPQDYGFIGKEQNEGGGDCLFHAFAQGMQSSDGESQRDLNAVSTRAMCVLKLTTERDAFEEFWDMGEPTLEETLMTTGYDKYLELIAVPGAWGGNLEVLALARGYDVPVVVCSGRMPPQLINSNGRGEVVYLWFDELARHYENLLGIPNFSIEDDLSCSSREIHRTTGPMVITATPSQESLPYTYIHVERHTHITKPDIQTDRLSDMYTKHVINKKSHKQTN